jgi:hypothetical protein
MFDKDGNPLFPFYWTSNPCVIKGVDEELLTPYESEVIAFLDSFSLFEINELLDLETDYPSLVTYLHKLFFCLFVLFCLSAMSGICPYPYCFLLCRKNEDSLPRRMGSHLARAKEKKAQEGNVDPSAALKIRDSNPSKGTKRKRRTPAADLVKGGKLGPEHVSVEEGESQDHGVKDVGDTLQGHGVKDGGDTLEEDKTGGESSHKGGVVPPIPSPLGDSFDAEEFIKSSFVLPGNLERFESMGIRDLRKLALGFEFKGMVLNYFLSARQENEAERASRAFEDRLSGQRKTLEASHATSVEELVESHRSTLEKARAASEERLQALKEVYAKDRAEKEKKLLALEKDLRNSAKVRNGLIVALAMAEDDASGFEEEVVELEESNAALKDALGEKYAEGFSAALEQIKVLFSGLDEATFNQADIMKVIDGDKLVSRVPEAGNSGEMIDSHTSPDS